MFSETSNQGMRRNEHDTIHAGVGCVVPMLSETVNKRGRHGLIRQTCQGGHTS